MKKLMGRVRLCCFFVMSIAMLPGTSTTTAHADEIAGKIIAVKGKVITIYLNKSDGRGLPSVGDKVDVSYRIGEDMLEVGTWRVSKIADGKSIEANLEKAEVEPNIGMDALVHATGTAAGEGKNETSIGSRKTGNRTGAVKATLGLSIQDLSAEVRERHAIPALASGVLVLRTKPGAAAEKAGILKEDIIVSIDGEAVTDGPGAANLLGRKKPGDNVDLVILRGGQSITIIATLDAAESGGDNNDGSFTGTADERFDLAFKLYEGKDVMQDKSKALTLLRQGAEEGHPGSMRSYGWLYEKGEAGLPQNDKEAFKWYSKAAQAGDNNAVWLMGVMYADGRGVPKDVLRAVELYEQACNKGFNSGCHNIAWHYYTGTGVPKNVNTARTWYEKSCSLGHAGGCSMLGWIHYNSEGGSADKNRGIELLQKGCSLGDKWGCERMVEIR